MRVWWFLGSFHSSSLQTPTVQVAAQQLQSEAQALVGGSLRVDPDEAGHQGPERLQLRRVVVLITSEYLRGKQREST